MKSGNFIYGMKKKKDLEKLLFSVDLVVLQNSPWEIERGRNGKICICAVSWIFLIWSFVLGTKENWRRVVVILLSCN